MAKIEDFSLIAEDLQDRVKPGRSGPALDNKGTQAWIEALPRADTVRTGSALKTQLRSLNALRLAPGNRVQLLDLLRRIVADNALLLERQIGAASFPLNEQKRAIGDLLVDVELELARGYRAALHDLCGDAGKVSFLRRGLVTTVGHRAAVHQARALLRCYQMYVAAKPRLWLRLHAVYALLERAGLADRPVYDELAETKTSATQTYLRALLLALANPYRLTQTEMAQVDAASALLGDWCELSPEVADTDGFVVHQGLDRGPGYRGALLGDGSDGPVLGLHTSALNEQLQAALAAAAGLPKATVHGRRGQTYAIDRELLERLMLSWGLSAARGHARLEGGHELDAAIGLSAAHWQVSGGESFETFLAQVMRSTVTMLASDRGLAWTGEASGAPTVLRSRVIDQSLGGYRVAWEASESLRARVGEAVVVTPQLEDPEPEDWMFGVIRWLVSRGDGYLEAGIELLSRRLQPVAVRVTTRTGRVKPPQRGLLLKPLRADNGAGRLLVVPSVLDLAEGRVQIARPAGPDEYQVAPELEELSGFEVVEATSAFQLLRI